MKSVQLVAQRCLEVREMAMPPEPGPGEVLVRVRAVGVCGSDIHWFAEGGIGEAQVRRPFVLGHEFGGVTEDGRRVAVDPAIPCEACPSCLAGHANLCP